MKNLFKKTVIGKLSDRSLGMLIYLSAMLVTVALNIFVKSAIVKYKLPTWEVLCVRQSIIVMCLIPLMIKRKFNFFDKTSFKPNVFRNTLFAFTTFALYTGMSKVPLNDATAITFLTPILGSILAVKLLKEPSSKAIWISLALAIIGVFIIQKPGFKDPDVVIGYGALMISVIGRSYIVVLNKRLTAKFDTMTMLFYTHIMMLVISACFFYQFKAFPLDALKYIAGSAFFFFIEYYLIFKAYKHCEAIRLQPLDFSRLLFMMFFSSILLDEHVKSEQIVGGVIILCGYIFIIFDKNNKQKKLTK